MSNIDLHVHSNCSDGSDTPNELIKNIMKANISIFGLSDHDTVSGILEIQDKIPTDVKFIPAVELTCIADDIKCHILGYNINPANETLSKLIAKGKILRKNKLETRIKYLRDTWNIKLTQEELDWLYSRKSVVKTHIANILVNRGLASDNVSAMKKYLDGCKSGDTRFIIQEGINAIADAKGIPVWAHPLGGEGEEHDSVVEFLPKLKKMMSFGIKGLECYYSRYNQDEISLLVNCAKQNNLLITGGSDYHGTNKTIPLGKLNAENINIEKEKLTILNYI